MRTFHFHNTKRLGDACNSDCFDIATNALVDGISQLMNDAGLWPDPFAEWIDADGTAIGNHYTARKANQPWVIRTK